MQLSKGENKSIGVRVKILCCDMHVSFPDISSLNKNKKKNAVTHSRNLKVTYLYHIKEELPLQQLQHDSPGNAKTTDFRQSMSVLE